MSLTYLFYINNTVIFRDDGAMKLRKIYRNHRKRATDCTIMATAHCYSKRKSDQIFDVNLDFNAGRYKTHLK